MENIDIELLEDILDIIEPKICFFTPAVFKTEAQSLRDKAEEIERKEKTIGKFRNFIQKLKGETDIKTQYLEIASNTPMYTTTSNGQTDLNTTIGTI